MRRFKDWFCFRNKNKQRQVVSDKEVEIVYNAQQQEKQQKIDALLDKILAKGIQSLTKKEKAFLEEHTK